MYYFAYGNNMIKGKMDQRCRDAKFIGNALLKKFKFMINSRGVATIIPNDKAFVEGILWEISPEDLNTLDTYEGVNQGYYLRNCLSVINEETNDECCANVYAATDETPGTPKPGYLERIINVAERCEFKAEYIDYLERLFDLPFTRSNPIRRDKPTYLQNSERWLERAKGNKATAFSKFFYLWASFNALYNLEEVEGDMSQIKSLIAKISGEDAQAILNKQKRTIDYFFEQRAPIRDMKEMSDKETKSWQKKFTRSANYKNKLKYVALTLYIVRNNLTHGSKMDQGDDLMVIERANCILEEIVNKCVETVGNL